MYGLVCAHVGHARHATNSQAHLRIGRFLSKPDSFNPHPTPLPPVKPVHFFLSWTTTFITLLGMALKHVMPLNKKIYQPKSEHLNKPNMHNLFL